MMPFCTTGFGRVNGPIGFNWYCKFLQTLTQSPNQHQIDVLDIQALPCWGVLQVSPTPRLLAASGSSVISSWLIGLYGGVG